VLLLFNTTERLSYTDIKGQLNLTDEDIMRLLHSLSCAKYKILNKEPNSKAVTETDSFEFNTKFTDKMRRIKVYFLLASFPQLGFENSKMSCYPCFWCVYDVVYAVHSFMILESRCMCMKYLLVQYLSLVHLVEQCLLGQLRNCGS
jgi:hypothetical protein